MTKKMTLTVMMLAIGSMAASHACLAQPRSMFPASESPLFRVVSDDAGVKLYDGVGNVLVEAGQYSSIDVFAEGLAVVNRHDKFGYIDLKGQRVIELNYEGAHRFSEGIAGAKVDGRWGFINRSGDFEIAAQFDFVHEFRHGYAIVRHNGGHGVIDRSGKFVFEPKFKRISSLSQGTVGVEDENGAYHLSIDTRRPLYQERFEAVRGYLEGLAPFRSEGKWGYINRQGEIKIEAMFDDARGFSEGRAPVFREGQGWGYIDSDGVVVIEPKFERLAEFRNGRVILESCDPPALMVVNHNGDVLDALRAKAD